VDYSQRWVYDADGHPTLFEVDENGDGVVDYEQVSTYDAVGRIVSAVGTAHPTDAPTYAIVDAYTWSYTDPVLQIGTVEADWRDDGRVDQVMVFEHDADGRLLWFSTDWENDGVVDQDVWYTYDADGHELTFTEHDYEFPAHGGAPTTRVYEQTGTWDALGRQIELRVEAPADTSSTTLWTWTFGGTCPS
jgi:hypothetical protein